MKIVVDYNKNTMNNDLLNSSAPNPNRLNVPRTFYIKIQTKNLPPFITTTFSDVMDYDKLIHHINTLMHTHKIPKYTILQDKLPWDDLPKNFAQCLDHLTVVALEGPVPKEAHQYSVHDMDYDISYNDSTLKHFLAQPESKALHYLQGEAYRKKIYEETDRMLNTYTDQNQEQLQKFVTMLRYLVQNTKTEKELNIYNQWIIKLASMTSFLPPSLTSEIKKLSQNVFDDIMN